MTQSWDLQAQSGHQAPCQVIAQYHATRWDRLWWSGGVRTEHAGQVQRKTDVWPQANTRRQPKMTLQVSKWHLPWLKPLRQKNGTMELPAVWSSCPGMWWTGRSWASACHSFAIFGAGLLFTELKPCHSNSEAILHYRSQSSLYCHGCGVAIKKKSRHT